MKKSFFLSFIILMVFSSNAAIPSASKNNDTTVSYTSKLDEKMVKDAMQAFKSLSKAERKARFGEVKSLVKNYRQQQNEDGFLRTSVSAGLTEGGINNRFWISLLLSLLFFLPGIIYALIVVLT